MKQLKVRVMEIQSVMGQKNQSLPVIISTPKHQSAQTVEIAMHNSVRNQKTVNESRTNVSFLNNDKVSTKPDVRLYLCKHYFASPLLMNSQMKEVERQQKKRHNEFYSKLLSNQPFDFLPLEESHRLAAQQNVSGVQFRLVDFEDKSAVLKILDETSNFADKLSQHHQRIKPQNWIPQRQDVIKLAQWVDYSIETIKKQELSSDEQLERIEKVFTLSLKELVREISIDCLEKSVLLDKIWTGYVQFTYEIMSHVLKEKDRMEKDYLDQIARVHKTYQSTVDAIKNNYLQQQMELKNLQLKYQKKKNKCRILKENNAQLLRELQSLSNELVDLKQEKILAVAEKERLTAFVKINEYENQKLQQMMGQKVELKKRGSMNTILNHFEENSKATDTRELHDAIHVTEGTQSIVFQIECNTQGSQTNPVRMATHVVQTDIEDEIPSYNNIGLSHEDEIKLLKQRKAIVEDKLKQEQQLGIEYKKQKIQYQKEIDQKSYTITNQTKEIQRLMQELANLKLLQEQQQLKSSISIIVPAEENNVLSLVPSQKSANSNQKIDTILELPENETDNIIQTAGSPSKRSSRMEKQRSSQPTSIKPSKKIISPSVSPQKSKIKITVNESEDRSQFEPQTKSQPSSYQSIDESNKSQITQQESKVHYSISEPRQFEDTDKPIEKSNENSNNTKNANKLSVPTSVRSNKRTSVTISNPKKPTANSTVEKPKPEQKYVVIPAKKPSNIKRPSVVPQQNQNNKRNSVVRESVHEVFKNGMYTDIALQFMNDLTTQFWAAPELVEASMPVANVLKLIGCIYKEGVEKKYPLYSITYEFYMNTFGLKNISEQKLIQFCSSVFHYRHIPRIHLFGRFLHLFEKLNEEDQDLYYLTISQIDDQNLFQCAKDQTFVPIPFVKIVDSIKQFNDAQQLEQILKKKQKIINQEKYLDLDDYFAETLEQFQLLRTISKENYKDLFQAIDINQNGFIELDEMTVILDLIESDNTPQFLLQIKQDFLQQSSKSNGTQSIQQFGLFCMRNQLFTKYKQDRFIGKRDDEFLTQNWASLRRKVTQQLRDCQSFSEYYQDLIRKLDESIKKKEPMCWFMWRILDEQSQRLYTNMILNGVLLKEFNMINDCYNKISLQ